MKDYMEILSRKGKVTVLEHTGGKTIVAIEAHGGALTLEGASAEQLLSALCRMCQNCNPLQEPQKHGRVVGPNPQDRSEGLAALVQGWQCECGRINGAMQDVCPICDAPKPIDPTPEA